VYPDKGRQEVADPMGCHVLLHAEFQQNNPHRPKARGQDGRERKCQVSLSIERYINKAFVNLIIKIPLP